MANSQIQEIYEIRTGERSRSTTAQGNQFSISLATADEILNKRKESEKKNKNNVLNLQSRLCHNTHVYESALSKHSFESQNQRKHINTSSDSLFPFLRLWFLKIKHQDLPFILLKLIQAKKFNLRK